MSQRFIEQVVDAEIGGRGGEEAYRRTVTQQTMSGGSGPSRSVVRQSDTPQFTITTSDGDSRQVFQNLSPGRPQRDERAFQSLVASSGASTQLFGRAPAEGAAEPAVPKAPGLFGKPIQPLMAQEVKISGRPPVTSGGTQGQRKVVAETGEEEGGRRTQRAVVQGARLPGRTGTAGRTFSSLRSRGLRGRPNITRRTSVEKREFSGDPGRNTVLIIKNIPEEVNTRPVLFSHFSQYGGIARMYNSPSKMQATIHFETHRGAVTAKQNGSIMEEGGQRIPLVIFWRKQTDQTRQAAADAPRPARSQPPTTTSRKPRVDRSDVDDELSALKDSADDFTTEAGIPQERPAELVQRPSRMAVMGTGLEQAPRVGRAVVAQREMPKASAARPTSQERRIVSKAPAGGGTKLDPATHKPVMLFGKAVATQESKPPSGATKKAAEKSQEDADEGIEAGPEVYVISDDEDEGIEELDGSTAKAVTRDVLTQALFGAQSKEKGSALFSKSDTSVKAETTGKTDKPELVKSSAAPHSSAAGVFSWHSAAKSSPSQPLFGGSGQGSTAGKNDTTTPSAGLFGKQATSSQGPGSTGTGLFGKLFQSAEGKPLTPAFYPAPKPFSIQTSGLFSKSSPPAATTLKSSPFSLPTGAPPGGLFGKPASAAGTTPSLSLFSQSPSMATPALGLFGRTVSGAGSTLSSSLPSQPASVSTTPAGLFGKVQSEAETTSSPPAGLFGKPASVFSQPAVGLFGKPEPADTRSSPAAAASGGSLFASAPVFGKPVSSTEEKPLSVAEPKPFSAPAGLFGKPATNASTTVSASVFSQPASGTTSSVGTGLFGKPLSSTGAKPDVTAISQPGGGMGTAGARLFKPASAFSAAPATSASQPAVLESTGIFGSAMLKASGSSAPAENQKPRHEPAPVGSFGPRRDRSPSPGPARGRSASPRPRRPSIELDSRSLKELQSLQRRVAQTAAEKVDILDIRDKLLHKARKKKEGRTRGEKVTHGTCPDMCPEKERLMREEQRRLHPYEVLAGTEGNPKVDHARAVKEYSRSSADQEFPLPHELRPAPVLRLSMQYLLSHIADLGRDGGWGDWFDFLWSRTRGIRKDITQQRLCDLASVELLEQCTRFHIYCAERLCEEDPSIFDVKINNENLTKCLQSLKEMYHDLQVKQGVRCPHEPEFRAYMVLMNLNEGDILREVQQLDESILASPEVTFVVNVYSALNSNNYVRFFKLVRRATFLNACIMHRYFTQVRVQALRAIIRSHTNPGSKSTMPLSDLVRLLAFEDEQHVERFCAHHELATENSGLVLHKSNQVILPETVLPAQRAITVVEGKLSTSVGEVMNGGPMEEFVLPTPTSSFDSQGRFKGLDVDVEEVEEEMLETEDAEDEATSRDAQDEAGRRGSKISNEAVKHIAKELFIEVIQEMALGVSQGYVQMIQMVNRGSELVIQDIVEEETKRGARDIAEETLTSARQAREEQEARERAETALIRQLATEAVADAITDETMGEMAEDVATEEYREVQQQLKQESQERCSQQISQTVMEEVVGDLVVEVSADVHETDVVQKLQQLEEASQVVRLVRTLRWWSRWLQVLSKRKKLKRAMFTFPSAPSFLDPTQQLDRLVPDAHGLLLAPQGPGLDTRPEQRLQGTRLTLQGAPDVYAQQIQLYREMMLHGLLRRQKHQRAWAPLDLCGILEKAFYRTRKPAGSAIYWKLLVSVEDLSEAEDTCATWLLHKFQKGKLPPKQSPKSVLLSLYTAPPVWPTRRDLGVCVRGLLGQPESSMRDGGNLQGAACVMFLITIRELEKMELVCQRLAGVLSLLPLVPTVPVAILVQSGSQPGRLDLAQLAFRLDLPQLKADGLLSEYVMFDIGVDIEEPFASTEVAAAVAWLAEHPAGGISVESCSLRELLETTICREYSSRVYQDLASRRKMNSIHQDPNLLIDLYNSIVEFLADQVVADCDLCDLSWPVAEFAKHRPALPAVDWNSPKSLSELKAHVLSLRLPEFTFSRPESEEWEDARRDVMQYLQCVTFPTGGSTHIQLFSRVRWLLEKAEDQFELDCFWVERVRGAVPCYVNMPWVDVIEACIAFRLQEVPWDEDEGATQVHYLQSKLSTYKLPASWLQAVVDLPDQDQSLLASVQRASTKRKKSRHVSHASPQKQPKLSRRATAGVDLEAEPAALREARELANRLHNLIGEEKKASARLNNYLDECISSKNKEVGDDTGKRKVRRLFAEDQENQGNTLVQDSAYISAKRKGTPGVPSVPKETATEAAVLTQLYEGAKRPKYLNVLAEKLLGQTLEEEMEELQRKVAGAKQDERLLELRLQTILLQAELSPQ